MIAALNVSDEIVIGFFSAAFIALSAVVTVLWRRIVKCEDERLEIWKAVGGKPSKNKGRING